MESWDTPRVDYVQMERIWVIAIAVDNQLRHRRIAIGTTNWLEGQ